MSLDNWGASKAGGLRRAGDHLGRLGGRRTPSSRASLDQASLGRGLRQAFMWVVIWMVQVVLSVCVVHSAVTVTTAGVRCNRGFNQHCVSICVQQRAKAVEVADCGRMCGRRL